MKKQLVILLLFFNCTLAWSQGYWMKTTTPCDKELLKTTPGEWMTLGKGHYAKLTQSQLQQIENRLAVIHQWVKNIYPSPMAFDAMPFYASTNQDFASQIKIENTKNGFRNSFINGIGTVCYTYGVKFCDYHCGREANEIMRGRGCEAGTSVNTVMNSLESFFSRLLLDDFYMDVMRIEDRPIRMMPVLKGKWKGYDLYSPESGSGVRMILLHRDGILPYIPVTRKQYLERSIQSLQRYFDKVLIEWEKNFKIFTDAGMKPDAADKEKIAKQKKDILKYYQDELDVTTKAGLFDTPAIIFGEIMQMYMQYPIFMTQAEGGRMLVTENPAYLRKDLPKYIPQLIIYSMWDGQDGPDPAMNPYKLYYQDFPIEKLQAMIDK
jgi:hypothetical protein